MTGVRRRRDLNLALFERLAPGIHRVIAGLEASPSHASPSHASPSHASPYHASPAGRPVFQVSLSLSSPKAHDLDPPAFRFVDAFRERLAKNRILSTERRVDRTSLISCVVGCGDGAGVARFVEETECCELIAVNQTPEGFADTLDTCDWTAIAKTLAARAGQLLFISAHDPGQAAGCVADAVSATMPGGFDGMAITSFSVPPFSRQVVERLASMGRGLFRGMGHVYDECLMIRNARCLAGKGPWRAFRKTRAARGRRIFVAGSGPSLDHAISDLARARGGSLLISAGSALKPLLAAGLRPDFHVELENLGIAELLDEARAEASFDGITLVAPITVDPEAAGYFKDVVLFRRSALAVQSLMPECGAGHLKHASPTVVNAAAAFARDLGASEICLVGCDLGTRNLDRHHARRTWHDGAAHFEAPVFDIPLEANFGGRAFTNDGLKQGADNLERLIASADGAEFAVLNASDGVAVKGGSPVRLSDLQPEIEAPLASGEINLHFPEWETEYLLRKVDADEVRAVLNDQFDRIQELMRATPNMDDKIYFTRIFAFLDFKEGFLVEAERDLPTALRLAWRGSVGAILMFLEFHLSRIPEAEARRRAALEGRRLTSIVFEEIKEFVAAAFEDDGFPAFDDYRIPRGTALRRPPAPSRNDPCPCGSGRRYKACHGKAE